MKKRVCSLLLIFAIAACVQQRAAKSSPIVPPAARANDTFSPHELEEFTALEPIDTHTHDYKDNPAFLAMFHKLHLHTVDIIVFDRNPEIHGLGESTERADAWEVVRGSGGFTVLCTAFDPFKFSKPDFAETAIRRINRDFAQGAVALKIWKNIGMEILDAKGNYILPDNPVFEPIYRDIAAHNKTLIAHVADPDEAWKPWDPTSISYGYFSQNPKWHMNNKANAPSKAQILRARDHILEENPTLRLVGAHLGSMESDLHQLAQHLDRYPNFAVDMARMPFLMSLPRAEAIAFVAKYQDRLIYATDNALFPEEDVQRKEAVWEEKYASDWRALATSDTVVAYKGHKAQGLALPQPVLRKIYHDNAVKWFPGILGSH